MDNCDVSGWTGAFYGEGSFEADPAFLRVFGYDGIPGTADDLMLPGADADCIDAGDDAALPPDVDTDLRGPPAHRPARRRSRRLRVRQRLQRQRRARRPRDIANGLSDDCDADGLPDECERDCNGNGLADDCELFGPIIYVDLGGVGRADSGESWSNAYTDLQEALRAARCARGRNHRDLGRVRRVPARPGKR